MLASRVGGVHRAAYRLLALVVLAALAGLLSAGQARAVEETEPAPGATPAEEEDLTMSELRESSSSRAQEFFPDEYQEPSFFQWLSIPMLLVGLVIVLALLFAYLWWQPSFAEERRQKRRR